MSGVRLVPILLFVWVVGGLAWRLAEPPTTAIPSQLVNRRLPSFELPAAIPTKQGFTSADLVGRGPVLVNVFASWCVPCAGEAPVMNELKRRGVSIDAIAVRDTPSAIAAFLNANGDPYERIGNDPTSDVQISLGSSGVPETFVVDGRGVIRRQYIGPLSTANVPEVLQQIAAAR